VLRAWGEMCDGMPQSVRAHIEATSGVDAAVMLPLLPLALVDNPFYEQQLFGVLGRLPPSLVRGMDALATVSGLTLSAGEGAAASLSIKVAASQIRLWWPNGVGMGTQQLYNIR
jgi:hypothetical protein